MYSETTRSIKVTVRPFYLEQHSSPSENRYVWAYHVRIENAGEETVQLYIRDVVASVARPVKELRGFQKVLLQPGESKTLTFKLGPEDLKFYDARMKWVFEPGEFKIMVGGNSDELKSSSIRL